jgi:uncharacterized phiE125 gp8 family phage protein
MRLVRVTAPPGDVVSLADAKTHLHVDGSDDDAYIASLVAAATAYIDAGAGWLGRALRPQTWNLIRDSFHFADLPTDRHGGVMDFNHLRYHAGGFGFVLPFPPLISVDAITYVDTNNVTQTLDTALYDVLGIGDRGELRPAFNQSWPVTSWRRESVTIRFTCGYADTSDTPPKSTVPTPIWQAILLLVGHWYVTREAVGQAQNVELPFAVNALLSPYRVFA